MKRFLSVLLILLTALMFLVACGGTEVPNEGTETDVDSETMEEPVDETVEEEVDTGAEEATEAPPEEEVDTGATGDRVEIRWFVGLGTGTDPNQITVQEQVVEAFNASQDQIQLVLEVVPFDAARDTLATQIASGSGPDIIGPVGWGGSNAFYGQWLDLAPLVEQSGFDTSIFDPALVDSYQTEEGTVGLPFAVFPAGVYYVPAYFDEAGLAYPPQAYGEQYELDGEMVDWTWETVAEVARRLTIDVNGFDATEDEFDNTQIVQVGWVPQWQTHPNYLGSYVAGGADIVDGDTAGEYEPNLPAAWKEAAAWYYDAMWGDNPFTTTGPLMGSPEFGASNVFNAGKAAMATTPLWYTCCLAEFRDAGLEFQVGAMPQGADGQVHSRVDADTFRIWKGTANPEEAFTVLTYLITDGADTLLPAYGALPAIADKQDAFFEAKSQDYPFVTDESWDIFRAGLAYPDSPSAEQWQPNYNEAWARQQTFFDLIMNTPPSDIDFDAEWETMISDLEAIYNK